MRTKITLILVFLNVALFFFIFKFERTWRTERASLETRRRVLGPEAADMRALTVTSTTPGGSFSLARRGDTWWLTSPLEWPANPHAVNTIIHELQLLEHVSTFNVADLAQNNQHLSDYGIDLAKPRLSVAFSSGEAASPTATLRVGDATKDGSRLYLLSADGARIHVVNRSLADTLSLPLDQLRSDTLLDIPVFEASALSVQAGGARVRIRRESAQSTRWLFDTIIDARASKTAIDVALSSLNGLHPKSFNPANPPTSLPNAAPTLKITLEGNNHSETLFVGEKIGTTAIAESGTTPASPAAGKTEPDGEYYAQLDRRPAVFTVAIPADLVSALRNAPVALREKRVLDFDPQTVTAISLAAPVLSNLPPITLQRIEAPAGATADTTAAWQIVRRGTGAPNPQPLPADRGAVQRLLEQLAALSAKNFQTDAATNADLENWGFKRPEREVTLTLAGSATPLVLQIGTDPQRDLYALVGAANAGSSIYAIDKNFADELHIVVRDWRERTLSELPAVARLTAIKLTDLTTNQPLLDVVVDANGHAPAATQKHPAVETILTHLRSLRAKRFPQDGFTEKFVAAGDERTWRYKLDYTVTLPGGAGGEQTSVRTLLLSERLGGSPQLAGSAELDAVFEIEQPLVDALWTITYSRDPGAPSTPDAKP